MSGPTTTFNFAQIENLWTQNGGDPGWAPLAAGIALAESGGSYTSLNNNASTGDYSVGLWQINYFGSLLQSRTASFGSPQALQADPNAQAQAAIALSNNGTNWGPWRSDKAWSAWQAAGAPNQPTASQVQGWLSGAGVSQSQGSGGASATGPSNGPGCSGKCLIQSPTNSIPVVGSLASGCLMSTCQAKGLVGGLLVVQGIGLMLVGTVIVAAYGLGHTGGLTKAAQRVPGVRRGTQTAAQAAPPTGGVSTGDMLRIRRQEQSERFDADFLRRMNEPPPAGLEETERAKVNRRLPAFPDVPLVTTSSTSSNAAKKIDTSWLFKD